jgi:hypothetical protein
MDVAANVTAAPLKSFLTVMLLVTCMLPRNNWL